MLAVVRVMFVALSDQNMNAQERESRKMSTACPPERNFTAKVCRFKVLGPMDEAWDEGRRLGRKVKPSE
jgi:hypothetical protein